MTAPDEPDDHADDVRLDLSAWRAPTPPRGLSARVMTAVRAGSADAPDVVLDAPGAATDRTAGSRRWAGVIGGLVVGLAAAGVAWTWWPAPARNLPSSGQVIAAAPAKVSLGPGTVALLGAGADLRWQRDGDTLAVTHRAGDVTYQHTGPTRLVITTPVATVSTARATLHLEVPVNKTIVTGVASAAIAAGVTIAVYEGKAEVREPTKTPRVVESGDQVAVAAPPPRPVFPTVTRPTRDRAQRDALAAAIADARANPPSGLAARPAGGSSAAGGAIVPAAPAGGTAVVDATPGELSKEEVRDGVREVVPMLLDCYEDVLARRPAFKGQVIAKLTVDSEPELGTIVTMADDSEFQMGTVADDPDPMAAHDDAREFNQCLTATLESIVLPPLGDKDGGHVEITYPFVFSPAPAPATAINTTTAEKSTRPAPRPRVGASAPTGTPAELLARSEDAAKTSGWKDALRLANAAGAHPDADPGVRQRSHLVGALAACNLGLAAEANRHYAQVTKNAQRLIWQRCKANKVDVGPEPSAGSPATR